MELIVWGEEMKTQDEIIKKVLEEMEIRDFTSLSENMLNRALYLQAEEIFAELDIWEREQWIPSPDYQKFKKKYMGDGK